MRCWRLHAKMLCGNTFLENRKATIETTHNKSVNTNVIILNLIPSMPMEKSFTLSPSGVRFSACRPRPVLHKSTAEAMSPKPETLAFLKQFARAFYAGSESRPMDIVLN